MVSEVFPWSRDGERLLWWDQLLQFLLLSYKALPGMGYLPTGGTNLIKVQLATAEGTSLDENSRLMKILEERWRKIKGVRNLIAVPNRQDSRNVIFIVCDKEEDSGVSVGKIARQANAMASDLPFKFINPVQFPLFGNIYTDPTLWTSVLWVTAIR